MGVGVMGWVGGSGGRGVGGEVGVGLRMNVRVRVRVGAWLGVAGDGVRARVRAGAEHSSPPSPLPPTCLSTMASSVRGKHNTIPHPHALSPLPSSLQESKNNPAPPPLSPAKKRLPTISRGRPSSRLFGISSSSRLGITSHASGGKSRSLL